MKIKIEARPGELEDRLDIVLHLVREMAGGHLCKGSPKGNGDHPEAEAPLDIIALQQALDRVKNRQVRRIQRIMQRKIAEIILADTDT